MAIYDWPNTRTFLPQTAELRVVDNTQRSLESPLSGYVQTLSMPGARWGWGMDFGAQALNERDALESFLLRLNGREHRVRLWDLKRPQPHGSIQMFGVTLGATAAQFAPTLQLAGCRHPVNLLLGGSFEADSNADGLGDGWTVFVGGAGDGSRAHSMSRVDYDYNVRHGGWAQYIEITAASNSNDSAIASSRVAILPGTQYTLSGHMFCSTASKQVLSVRQFKGDGTTVTGSDAVTPFASTSSMDLRQITFTTEADAAFAQVFVRGITAVGQSMRVDAVQLEQGATATAYAGSATLLGGDWLGLATGQLVRVVADATANDAGAMTVDVRHMLRASVASGSAVTLDRPTALYVRTEAGLMLPRMPGLAAPGMSAEFVEVFA